MRTAFPVAVDPENRLGATLGYSVVPTGLFIDESGRICFIAEGTFDVANSETLEALDRFAAGELEWLTQNSDPLSPENALSLSDELAQTKVRLAAALLAQDRKEDALAELDRALQLDPENYIVRKQRWLIRYPDRFTPEIDWDWQAEQLARERTDEKCSVSTQRLVGCPIPSVDET